MAPVSRALALVSAVHGLKGKVKARSLTDRPGSLSKGAEVVLGRGRKLVLAEVSRSAAGFILAFEGIGSREAAQALLGQELSLADAPPQALPEGTYVAADLVGLAVVDEAGKELGKLKAVYPTGANDVYEVQPASGESWLLPAIRQVVKEVDLAGRKLVVRLMPGLGPEGS